MNPRFKLNLLGRAGVDSGQLCVIDPCYISAIDAGIVRNPLGATFSTGGDGVYDVVGIDYASPLRYGTRAAVIVILDPDECDEILEFVQNIPGGKL